MAKAHETWKVLPHRPIEHLADNLWRVQGGLENMPLKRVMTVARRQDGGLAIHNAVALDDASMAALDAWGPVTAILVPNGFHRLDAKIFKQRYPAARIYCPRGATRKVEEVVTVDGSYADFPGDDTIELHTLAGIKEQEGVMLVRSADGVTLVFNDAIFNMPHARGLAGWILRHITRSTGGPLVSRIFRLGLLKDKPAFRADLERLADTPELRRLIVSHHNMVEGDAASAIRQAASTL